MREARSIQRFVLISPKKLRVIANSLRGMPAQDVVEKLALIKKRGSLVLRKVISAALANAKLKGLSADKLILKEIQINEGPRLKRFRAGARGRIKPYKRRMSHIRVVLSETQEEKKTVTERKDKLKKNKKEMTKTS